MELDAILNEIYPLPDESINRLNHFIDEVSYPKGSIILKAEKVEEYIYFLKKGIARAFCTQEGEEITFWFGIEGDTVMSIKSYIQKQNGYEDLELLEDSDLYRLKSDELHKLTAEDIHIANWARKFAEKELLKTERRLISFQSKTALQRYQELIADHPQLLQRVNLGIIASYLGITQVSLSRIRSQMK